MYPNRPVDNPPSYFGPPRMRAQNGFGVAALTLGIIGAIFAVIPFLYLIGLVCGLVAIPFGIVGIVKSNRRMATNLGASVTGTTLGAAALLLSIFWSVFWVNAVDTAATSAQDIPVAVDEPEEADRNAGKPDADDGFAKKGSSVRDGQFTFKVIKTERRGTVGTNPYLRETAQGIFLLVHIKVTNHGDEPRMLDSGSQRLFDRKGREFEPSTKAELALGDESNMFLENINPGNSLRGIMIFDIPRNAKLKGLELHDSIFSGGVRVAL